MAGIGFELKRILQKDNWGSWAHAYLLGAFIVLGPFLCSITALAGLSLLSPALADLRVRQAFTSCTVYVFGASLIATGAVQVVVTRYLADLTYRGDRDGVMEALWPVLLFSAAGLLLCIAPVLWIFDAPPGARALLWTLHLCVGSLWIVVIFASAVEGHRAVVAAFAAGGALSFAAGLGLLKAFGLTGILTGYALGYLAIVVLLIRHLVAHMGPPRRASFAFLGYFREFPSLIGVGLLQNLGIWVDKFLFWTSDLRVGAEGLYTAPKYDSAMFFGFLTCLPAMTHFFVRIEADFAERFHKYFDEIFFHAPLDRISQAAAELRADVIAALVEILKVQGLISFACIYFGPELLHAVGLPVSEVGMFRFAALGSLFLSFLMFSNVILLYLDLRRQVLSVVGTLFLCNLLLSALSLRLGYPLYGVGFAASCLLGLLLSLYHLLDQLHDLEYRTFSAIPLIGQVAARPGLRARPGGMFGRYQPIDPPGGPPVGPPAGPPGGGRGS